MPVLSSAINTGSQTFRDNAAAMAALVADIEALAAKTALGGDEKSRAACGRGKMLARERLNGFGEI
jgi:3-methylcrotonyl-CoA carboxylase beta subunit